MMNPQKHVKKSEDLLVSQLLEAKGAAQRASGATPSQMVNVSYPRDIPQRVFSAPIPAMHLASLTSNVGEYIMLPSQVDPTYYGHFSQRPVMKSPSPVVLVAPKYTQELPLALEHGSFYRQGGYNPNLPEYYNVPKETNQAISEQDSDNPSDEEESEGQGPPVPPILTGHKKTPLRPPSKQQVAQQGQLGGQAIKAELVPSEDKSQSQGEDSDNSNSSNELNGPTAMRGGKKVNSQGQYRGGQGGGPRGGAGAHQPYPQYDNQGGKKRNQGNQEFDPYNSQQKGSQDYRAKGGSKNQHPMQANHGHSNPQQQQRGGRGGHRNPPMEYYAPQPQEFHMDRGGRGGGYIGYYRESDQDQAYLYPYNTKIIPVSNAGPYMTSQMPNQKPPKTQVPSGQSYPSNSSPNQQGNNRKGDSKKKGSTQNQRGGERPDKRQQQQQQQYFPTGLDEEEDFDDQDASGGMNRAKNYESVSKSAAIDACRDWNKQQGSRYLQHLLSSGDRENINTIIQELLPQILEMSLNIFGNYVAQKMIEVAHLKQIMGEMSQNMEVYCFNSFGCRVVLKLFDIMAITDESQIENFANGFIEKNVLRMMTDQNANYIIQKIIYLQPSSKLGFVIDLFLKDTATYCDNPFACRVLQRLILKVKPDKRAAIFDQIKDRFYKLSFCQFGNYLIQHLAEKGTDSYKSILADMIADNVIEMSFDKFASNVVEKAVSNWNLDFIERLFEELKKPNRNNPNLPNLIVLIQNSYGNYVAQSIFKYADESIKRSYLKVLNSIEKKIIMSNNYSKHVYSTISNYFFNAKKEMNGNNLD